MKISAFGAAFIVALLLLGATWGCGGGNNAPSPSALSGRASVTITWPAQSPTRLIPNASQSIVVELKQGAKTVDRQTASRPPAGQNTVTLTFDPLPLGDLTVLATAYPNDGTNPADLGVAQARGMDSITIAADKTTPFSVTMSSTIDHIDLARVPADNLINVSQTVQAIAMARDINGALVLTTPSRLQWSSTNPAAASVDSSGLITGTGPGSATISVKDTESGVSAQTDIAVSLLSGLNGHIAYQVEYKIENQPKDEINAFLQEADIVNGSITVRTLIDPNDENIYSTLNPNFSPDGKWLVFYAITSDTSGKRNTAVDKYDIYLLDTQTPGAIPRNLTKTLFPNDRCQDAHFTPDGKQIIMKTEKGGQLPQIHLLNVNFASGTATEAAPPFPLPQGSTPLLLADNSVIYTDANNPDGTPSVLPQAKRKTATATTTLPYPPGLTSSNYVNDWGLGRVLLTVNTGRSTPDFLAFVDLTGPTPTATLLGPTINSGSQNGGNNSDACRVDDRTILFSRSGPAGYRLYIGRPDVDKAEMINLPGITSGQQILGESFSAN